MNNGVYALPGFMAPAAKNWKSQLLTNEDGSIKLCVYVGRPGTKVYYSLGIPGWKWGFIKDAQYFIDKGYPEDIIKEVSKFADYLDEEVTELPEGIVVPDIVINGWPVPITESPIEGKVYWILNIPKFILPAGDTEVQISANGKLVKYTITRPDFSIHYNAPYEHPAIQEGSSGSVALNGGYYIPEVSADGTLSWVGSVEGMPEVASVNIAGPRGPEGPPGPQGPKGDAPDGIELNSNSSTVSINAYGNVPVWGGGGVFVGAGSAVHVGQGSVAIGNESQASGKASIAIGLLNMVMDDGVAVFSVNGAEPSDTITRLYFVGEGTPLAQRYYNGEAFLGYITRKAAAGTLMHCGTKKLSALLNDNTTTQVIDLDDTTTTTPFWPAEMDIDLLK